MSLSAWEQQTLDSIRDGLASSDPTLVARLAMFTRLASSEEMPTRERVHAGRGRAAWRCRPGRTRRLTPQAAVLLWLTVTMVLIGVALAFSRDGSHVSCTGSWATYCSGATSTPTPTRGTP
jgi:Protein of unknown function (DUF3040)